MQNPSESDNNNEGDDDLPQEDLRPQFAPTLKVSDPVKFQKQKDKLFLKKTLDIIPEKQSIISAKITPSVGTRIDLQYVPGANYEEGKPKPKYVAPKTKKQKQTMEKNRPYTYKKFCQYETVKMADPIPTRKVDTKFTVPSPEPSSAKVALRKVSPTASWLYPEPQTSAELGLKKPKSGIFINETQPKEPTGDYDSFNLVYTRQPRPDRRTRKKRAKRQAELDDITEEGEEGRKKGRKRKKGKTAKKISQEKELSPEEEYLNAMEKEMENQIAYGEYGEGDMGPANYLTKQFRRKVSLMSNATSYQNKDFDIDIEGSVTSPALDKYAQKFRRESEIKRFEPKKRKFRRGTLESHSFTNIYQPILNDFYFGSKQGTMHQGDEHLPEDARNSQGICIPVAAYCFSFLKHPDKWVTETVDEILDVGSNLYLNSLNSLHVHRSGRDLRPEDLHKYCFIGDKKIRFLVDEPEVSGQIKSSDKSVFNLTKGLSIFFARQKAGLFQTQDTNLAIWKDKYFYLFDGKPRTKDLHYSPNGTAIMANFYDIPAVVTVLLQRSGMQNWPFVIYPIKAFKVLNMDEEDVEEKNSGLDAKSNYNILNENKAVLMGSYDLGDKCFGFTRNKQSLPMAVVCLVYSRITPPSAWHKTTLDKVMIIGNQLYTECMQCEAIEELALSTLPAFFTIGPYIVEIYIYANRMVDMMYEKCNCQLKCCLEEFFQSNSNAIVQIGVSHIAIWKQRNMIFCFDPYSRGAEGYLCRDGYACLSMHSNLESLVDVVTHNFDHKDSIFNIHALKVCKIHRDPVQSERFPRHIPLDEFPPDEFKTYKMRKSRKPATEKPVTVDYSAAAMRCLLMGETPSPSILEIGSHVESLALEQIPPLLHADRIPPNYVVPPYKAIDISIIADLDSPSLSDTQIPPPRPSQPKEDEAIPFMDLDSFDLTQEEIELGEVYGEGYDKEGDDDIMEDQEGEDLEAAIEKEMARQAGEGEDYYYSADEYAQVRAESLMPITVSEEINTDLTYFPIRREILYPTYVRGKQQMKSRINRFKKGQDWEDFYVPIVPDVTKSEELGKDTNFIDLPDDTQIIRGTKNVSAFGEEIEFIAPFVCVMADVVAKKYSILSWTTEIVDYILKCGVELYNASKFRYDQVSKLEIPQISLGRTKFACLVEYVFDSYTRQNILELAIDKILFVRSDMGVLVTPTYACALIYKNYLYYMFDGFGNNEVGLSEGLSENGTACFSRFKDIHSLTTRIMYNKRKRENNEDVIYTRFVLSTVRVKRIDDFDEKSKKDKKKQKDADLEEEMADEPGEDDEVDYEGTSKSPKTEDEGTKKEPENKVGIYISTIPGYFWEYMMARQDLHNLNLRNVVRFKADIECYLKLYHRYQHKNGVFVIEGTRAIADSEGGDEDEEEDEQRKPTTNQLQEDHFACICACLMLLSCPVEKWDTKKVDEVLEHGSHVYSHADDLEMSEKRTIKNILIGKNFFDIIVKKVKIENWRDNKNLNRGIDTLMRKRMTYFLVQFPDSCYVVHKSTVNESFNLFYPRGLPKKKTGNGKNDEEEGDGGTGGAVGGWLRCNNIDYAKRRLKKAIKKGAEAYEFYTFEVTSIRKAPKNMLINYRLNQYELEKPKKPEQFGKPFYEDVEWLKAQPTPWSRLTAKNPDGKVRGVMENLWGNWDTEYSKDLFSLLGNIHQDSERFPEESRGKQTLCNLVTCIGMLEIYDFTEWNSAVIDSILVNGDQYFYECIEEIKDEDYELSIEDLKEDCSIFPFAFKVAFKPVVEGTMFLVRPTQFNLFKALRLFFDRYDRRSGIICCTKSHTYKRQVAFGKTKPHEYYMFEADAHGSPMFMNGLEKAYILRTLSLNRLLHVLTLTLRGGDFFVYEVKVTDLKPI